MADEATYWRVKALEKEIESVRFQRQGWVNQMDHYRRLMESCDTHIGHLRATIAGHNRDK